MMEEFTLNTKLHNLTIELSEDIWSAPYSSVWNSGSFGIGVGDYTEKLANNTLRNSIDKHIKNHMRNPIGSISWVSLWYSVNDFMRSHSTVND